MPCSSCSTSPANTRLPARLALRAVTMTIFAGCPARGHSGSKVMAPHFDAQSTAAASAKAAAGMMRLTLPFGRTTRVSSPSQRRNSSGTALWARSRLASGEAVSATPNQGGLLRTWSKDCDAKGRAAASAKIAEKSFNLLILKFSLASVTSAGSRSTPTPRTPGTRVPRHSSAAPAPVPASSTVSPALAFTQAASSTGSNPLRWPSVNCL